MTRLPLHYARAVILLALLLGGGTAQNLWTDHLLELFVLPALFLGLGAMLSTRLDAAGIGLVAAILILLLCQFLPLPRAMPLPETFDPDVSLGLLSPAPHKSLESTLFTLSVLGFFLLLTRFSDRDQERCLGVLLLGLSINVAAGAIQLSFEQRAIISGILPFEITAGFFANKNHLSSLIYVMIPLLGYRLLARHRRMLAYCLITGLLVGFLFAVGSRAGTSIAATLAVMSLLWFRSRELSLTAKLCLLAGWIASIIVISLLLGFDTVLAEHHRLVFYFTTIEAIRDHLPFGTGLGTFTLIYPAYEARENVLHAYANHAHNDVLELTLETGLAGLVLLAVFVALVWRSFSRSRLSKAAFIGILALLLHSIVDYPMRTMALGVVFAWLAAVVLSVRPFDPGETQGDDFRAHGNAVSLSG